MRGSYWGHDEGKNEPRMRTSYAYDSAVRDVLLHAQVVVEVRKRSGGLHNLSSYATINFEGF
jgi:hypothetical protein